MAKRKSKLITKAEDVKDILALTHETASEKETIMSYFCDYGNGPRFNPYDIIEIPAGMYGTDRKKNKKPFTTTIGLYVFNKSFIEPLSDILGYINETVNVDKYDEINTKLSYAIIEGKITVKQLKEFIMQSQILMGCTAALCPSHTEGLMRLSGKAEKKLAELEKKYAEGLKNRDLSVMKQLENEMVAWAKGELKDDEAADMFISGARSSWNNHFKNMYLVKGPVKLTDGSYSYIGTSHMTGLKKSDIVDMNDAAVGGPFSRARKTQEGGYLEKQFVNATQHIKVLGRGSDCGTDRTIKVHLDNKNISDWMYSFVQNSNGTTTEITSDNRDKFIGKTVNMRFSALCRAKPGCICEKCAGSLYNRIGIANIGLGTMVMMSSLKNKSMKAFHDAGLKMAKIDINKVF